MGFVGTVAGAGVTSGNDDALWTAPVSNTPTWSLVAREGSQAPGLPAGVTFGSFGSITGDAGFQFGPAPAFIAQLQGTGVDASNDAALFATVYDGSLAVIAREG